MKSFVKAAKRNFITQPSVSIHLKQLEEELQVKLFDRVPKKVVLTEAGRSYLPYVEEILNKCDNLLAIPEDSKGTVKGVIRIASIHSIGMYELGPFLRTFMEQYPGIQIHLEYQDAYNVYDLVQKRKIHIGMVAYPKEHLKINTTIYGKDKLGLIVPANHALAKKKYVAIEQIADEPFVAFDTNTPTREQIDKLLKKYKVLVNIKMINNNVFALKKAVEAGIGISIVPLSTVEDEVRRGDIYQMKLDGKELYRPLALITPKNSSPGKVEAIFVNSLIAYNNAWNIKK